MNIVKTGMLLAAMTALFLGVGYLIGGTGGALIALVVAVATNAYAYWNSDKLALRMHRARPVTRASAPELYGLVEELSRKAGLPMPGVYVIDSDQPNAFATGRSPENAAVAATTGIIRSLSREELAGVMAHELSHVKNRDTLIMTVAATVAGAISMLAQFGFFFGGMGNSRDRGGFGIIGLLLSVILAPLAAMLIQIDDQPHARVFGRPHGRRALRQPALARLGIGQDLRGGAAGRDALGRAQPGLGASLHRQPALGRAHGQSVLDASGPGQPHRGAAAAGGRDGPARDGTGGARRRARLCPLRGAAPLGRAEHPLAQPGPGRPVVVTWVMTGRA